MLLEILTYHQVMPDYLDFVSIFGLQSEARDLRFSGFKEQTNMRNQQRTAGIAGLARSGRQYQLCYNLKGVTLKSQDPSNPALSDWSIRQAAFYHKFDIVTGNALWLVTKGGIDVQQRFKELTGPGARPEDNSFGSPAECFRSSLSAHLLFCHWSSEDWRGYIKWLENSVDAEVSLFHPSIIPGVEIDANRIAVKTLMAVIGPRGQGHHHRIYTAVDIQHLQKWEERINEVIAILQANVEVMSSLKRFYSRLPDDKDFPLRDICKDDIGFFATMVGNFIDEFNMQISRASVFSKLTKDRKDLVS